MQRNCVHAKKNKHHEQDVQDEGGRGGICLFTLNGNCFLHLFDFHPRAECSIYAFTLSKKKIISPKLCICDADFGDVPDNIAVLLPPFLPNCWQGQKRTSTSTFLLAAFVLVGSRRNNLKPPPLPIPQHPNIYIHTHKRTFSTSTHNLMEPECRICSFTPRRLRKITAKRRDILQINFSPASEAYAKTKVPWIISIGEQPLQSSVAQLISLPDILLFPSVSQYAPMVALKNPSSVSISSMHVIALDTRTLLS